MGTKKITKLVLPFAGLGKRLLPLTERIPKALVPLNKKPLLEYFLDEAISAGIKEVVLIINPTHRKDFKSYLRLTGPKFPSLKFHIREQATPGGNGHAIVQAYDVVRGEPFVVRFCDDIVLGQPSVVESLIELFGKYKSSIFLLERVPWNLVSRFGVVSVNRVSRRFYKVKKIVEKPKRSLAPSNLTIVGGYVVTPSAMRNLKSVADTLPVIADDALPIAVAFQIELIIGGKVYGWEFPGKRLDCGTLEKLRRAEELLKKERAL